MILEREMWWFDWNVPHSLRHGALGLQLVAVFGIGCGLQLVALFGKDQVWPSVDSPVWEGLDAALLEEVNH